MIKSRLSPFFSCCLSSWSCQSVRTTSSWWICKSPLQAGYRKKLHLILIILHLIYSVAITFSQVIQILKEMIVQSWSTSVSDFKFYCNNPFTFIGSEITSSWVTKLYLLIYSRLQYIEINKLMNLINKYLIVATGVSLYPIFL